MHLDKQMELTEKLLMLLSEAHRSGDNISLDAMSFTNAVLKDIQDGHKMTGDQMRQCNKYWKEFNTKIQKIKEIEK